VNRLRTLLGEDGTVLLDGGMGTLLQEQGLDDGGSGELWNVERPDVIAGLHEEYAKAGARILTTNTFGGTRPRLEMHGLADRLHEVNRAGAAIATEVARRHGILVAGDLGPTGELLAPLGTMEGDEAEEIFAEQLTSARTGEVLIVAQSNAGLPQLVGDRFEYDAPPDELADHARSLQELGVDLIGACCGSSPAHTAAMGRALGV
jgi:5-methyltetrahydrofolate--homocysteine methyltransferase